MDNQSALPAPIGTSQQPSPAPTVEPILAPSQQQYAVPPQGTADALARASSAIEAVIAQTPQNPSARLQAIADIKATYIKEQFGVDVAQ